MRRRRFLLGLGAASSAAVPGLTAGRPGRERGRGNGRDGPPADAAPVENDDTGETYDAIGPALEAASPGETLVASLGATFAEDVEVDVEDLTLRAAANARPSAPPTASTDAIVAIGNEAPTVETDADALLIEASGNAAPTVRGDLDLLVLEVDGNATPTVEGDVDRAVVAARGNPDPRIVGDVGQAVVRTRGDAAATVEGDVDELVQSPRTDVDVGGDVGASRLAAGPGQPRIEGDVSVTADGAAVEGFDVEADAVGIDVRAPNPGSVRLTNDEVTTGSGDADVDGLPDHGVGIRVAGATSGTELAVGDGGPNRLHDNAVGVAVLDGDGAVADVDVRPILVDNAFVGNAVDSLPRLLDPDAERGPSVDPGPPVEVLSSERSAGHGVRADLPDVALDEEGAITARAITVWLESDATVELALDPGQAVEDPELPTGFEPLDAGFEIDAELAADEIDAVRFTVAVDRDVVAAPERFSLHRRVDGEFQSLRTELVAETDSVYRFEVHSPGFSIFQAVEFTVGGVGGAGRELDGTLVLPPDDPVDETFLRLESSEPVDDLALEAGRDGVDVGDSLSVDYAEAAAQDLPPTELIGFEVDDPDVTTFDLLNLLTPTVWDVMRVTNTSDEPTTVRASVLLDRARLSFVRPELGFDDTPDAVPDTFVDLLTVVQARSQLLGEFVDVRHDAIVLAPGETVSLALDVPPNEPDEQLWAELTVPTLTEHGEVADGSEFGNHHIIECQNQDDAPVMYQVDWSSDGSAGWTGDHSGDGPYLRVPAYVTVNWRASSYPDGDEEKILVLPEKNGGGDGELIGFYDADGEMGIEGFNDSIGEILSAEEFQDGEPATYQIDLIYRSDNDCGWDQSDLILDDVGDLELSVELDRGTGESRWADLAGTDVVSSGTQYYTPGDSLIEESQEVVEEAFEEFRNGVIDAVAPGRLMTYRAARRAMGSPGNPVRMTIVDGAVSQVTGAAGVSEPEDVLADRVVEGFTGYFADPEEQDVELPLHLQDYDLAMFGPTVYVSSDPEEDCVDPDHRELSVEGQVFGGPVVLMGLDSELVPGHAGHGTPEEHAAMVASILDSVSNGGEGILVLGGDPDANSDIVDYWRHDVGNDPRVDEPVTFVNGADAIRDVDLEGYAMIGVVSSHGQIYRGLADEENQALADRQGDLAAFVNGGGGLLGKTQDGLSDPWEYISPVAEIEATHASNSTIEVTPHGEALGLTQSGMNGWCCYHEAFEEDSVPEFLDVLLRNPRQSGNPPAAIGGERVVVQTAVDLEVAGPANVAAGAQTPFDFALENRAEEAGDDVRLELTVESDDLAADDVELVAGPDLALEDGALVGELTDEPVAFPADLETSFTRAFEFREPASYDVTVEVVVDDTDQSVVRLPFGVRAVDDTLSVCD